MSADDTLVFGNFDPVTGRPTIDGFVFEDVGVITSEAEPGFVGGGQMTIGGAGLPPVVIRTVKDGNTLVLGITCRGDTSFDDIDKVVIALRQNGGSSAGPQRRIDIDPVWGNTDNANPAVSETGFGAAQPDPGNAGLPDTTQPADDDGEDPFFDIRGDEAPRSGPIYYQRSGATGTWTQYTPSQAADTTKYHTRVRSWRPPVASGSPEECAWSIEVRIPIDTSGGNTDWISLQDDFGLFIDVVRVFRNELAPGFGEYLSAQYLFPLAAPDLTGAISSTTDIPASSFGHGLMNAAAANGEGVRILNGSLGVGRRPRGDPSAPLSGTISRSIDNDLVALLENSGPAVSGINAEVRMADWGLGGATFASWARPSGLDNPSSNISLAAGTIASPATGSTTNQWDAINVGSEYDPPNQHQCIWVQLQATTGSVNFARSSTRRNMNFVDLSSEEREATVSGNGYDEPADGSDHHDFIMFTRCRKIVVKDLIRGEAKVGPETVALVGGALLAARDVPSPDHNVDVTHARAVTTRSQTQWDNSVVYLWINEGFRRTGKTLTVNGIKTEILDHRPADFGLAAHHVGLNDDLSWEFAGPGIAQYRPGVYQLRVPHKGELKLKTKLTAVRGGRAGDQSKDLPPARKGGPGTPGKDQDTGGGKDGCLGLLFAMVAIPATLLAGLIGIGPRG